MANLYTSVKAGAAGTAQCQYVPRYASTMATVLCLTSAPVRKDGPAWTAALHSVRKNVRTAEFALLRIHVNAFNGQMSSEMEDSAGVGLYFGNLMVTLRYITINHLLQLHFLTFLRSEHWLDGL